MYDEPETGCATVAMRWRSSRSSSGDSNMKQLVAQLTAISEARTDQELWERHVEIMRGYGFAYLLYGFTRYLTDRSLGDPADWIVLSTYPTGFTEVFVDQGLFYHAPMVKWVINNDGVCSWRHISEMRNAGTLTDKELEVVAFNAKFGLKAGYTVSFRGVSNRSRAGIALAVGPDRTQDEVDEMWKRDGQSITVINHMMHLKLLTLPYSGARPLTRRQIEVLQWVGDGKTNDDIAILMGLTVGTVEKHLRLARDALNVETTAQAVLKASFFNQMFLLDPEVREKSGFPDFVDVE